MRTTKRETMATVGMPPGPRGNVVLGSIGDLYRNRLRFVLDVARTYGDVAQYRVAHMRMYQVSHPAGVGRLLQICVPRSMRCSRDASPRPPICPTWPTCAWW